MSGAMTGGVDASIPLQAGKGVQQPNPLQQIGQFAQTANALNDLKLFPLRQQQVQQQVQGGQLGLTNATNAAVYQGLLPLTLDKNKPITHDSLSTWLANLESAGIPTHNIVNMLANSPQGDGPEFDAIWRGRIAAGSQTDAAQALGAVTPHAGSVDVGPAIQPTLTAPAGATNPGAVTPVGGAFVKGVGPQYVNTGGGNVPTNNGQPTGVAIPNEPSPADRNQLVQVWNPQKKAFDYYPRVGVAPMVNGAGQSVNGLPASGRIQPPAVQPGASGPSPDVQAPATPLAGGAAATSPLGSQQEAEAAVQHLGAARERANNYQSAIFPIEGALTSLEGADTGKGGEVLNGIRSYLGDTPLKLFNFMLPSSLSDQQRRQAFDEAQKYTTGMAIGGPGGARSDAGNAASIAANPNVHISNAAALAVTKSILAQRRMDQTGTLAFNNSGLPANQYDRFMNTWQTQQDPRAFAIDKMTPEDRAALVKSFGGPKTAAYQKFKASVQSAINAGVIPNPSGAAQ
jgi:hypothetical protein